MNEFSLFPLAHAASESPAAELEIPGKLELPAEAKTETLEIGRAHV